MSTEEAAVGNAPDTQWEIVHPLMGTWDWPNFWPHNSNGPAFSQSTRAILATVSPSSLALASPFGCMRYLSMILRMESLGGGVTPLNWKFKICWENSALL